MLGSNVCILPYLLFGCSVAFTQTAGNTLVPSSASEIKIPGDRSAKQATQPTPKEEFHPDFVKRLTIESFGYDASSTGPGFESPSALSGGTLTPHGLECPFCIVRPNVARISRYTLPEFGAKATQSLHNNHVNLFAGIGGVNAWRLDSSAGRIGRKYSSFNDVWLPQGLAGANVSVDAKQRLWLGVISRYAGNYKDKEKTSWATFAGSAIIRLGR